MTNASIAARRMHASGLLGLRPTSAVDAVRRLGAVQSQDYPGATWGLVQRVGRQTLADVTAAYDARRILRVHALRPTWHFLLPEDIRAVQLLTGPRVHAKNAMMYRRLEIDDPQTWRACRRVLVRALADGERTRHELSDALAEAGIQATGQRMTYIAMRAELDRLICSGAFRGKQFTYALLDDKTPAASTSFDRDTALADLVRRYFASHGPALVRDFVWWSGLTTADTRAGIVSLGDALVREKLDGKEYWSSAHASPDVEVPPGTIHLLPNYDEYLGSYADYDPIFDPSLPRARTIADVLGVHIVVRDGLVVGGWKRKLASDRAVIDMTILLPLSRRDERSLERAIDDYSRFVGMPVDVIRH